MTEEGNHSNEACPEKSDSRAYQTPYSSNPARNLRMPDNQRS